MSAEVGAAEVVGALGGGGSVVGEMGDVVGVVEVGSGRDWCEWVSGVGRVRVGVCVK